MYVVINYSFGMLLEIMPMMFGAFVESPDFESRKPEETFPKIASVVFNNTADFASLSSAAEVNALKVLIELSLC